MKRVTQHMPNNKPLIRALLAATLMIAVPAGGVALKAYAQDAASAAPAVSDTGVPAAPPAAASASAPAANPGMPGDPAATVTNATVTDEGRTSAAPAEEDENNPLQNKWIQMSIQDSFRNMARVRPPSVNPMTLDSLFFTTWQYELLKEAKRGFLARPATVGEMEQDPAKPIGERPRGPREVSLGGIVYVNGDNWTIWLNGQRITPGAMPSEIIDLQVKREYIQIKWYDSFNNLIYPIRLRPHQRFNLDSRIFLPGAAPKNL